MEPPSQIILPYIEQSGSIEGVKGFANNFFHKNPSLLWKWVSRSYSELFVWKSSQNSSNPVLIFWSSIPCVLCLYMHLLLNLRSPRDYVGSSVRSRLWYFLGPLDGASVREAHCEQASTAEREAQCAQATVARLVTFESLKWKYSFATNSALFMKLGSLLYVRCCHRSAKSIAVSNKIFIFQVTNIYLFCGIVTLST